MNTDPVKVSRVDLLAAFPLLRLIQAIPFGMGLQTLVPSAVVVAIGLWVQAEDSAYSVVPLIGLSQGSGIEAPVPVGLLHNLAMVLATEFDGLLFGQLCLMAIAVAFCTIAIARCIGVRISRGQRFGVVRALRQSVRCWRPALIALAVTLFIWIMMVALFRSLWWLGGFVPGSTSPGSPSNLLQSLATMSYVFSLRVLLVMWLLGTAAIGGDGVSGTEGLSRGVSYVLSKFWYAVAIVVSVIVVLSQFQKLFVEMASLATRLRIPMSVHWTQHPPSLDVPFQSFVWQSLSLSVFISGLSIGYLLLRMSVDGIPLDELDDGRSGVGA